MLVTGRYAQWKSRFLRYIDTRPNGDALRICILEGPYTPTTVIIPDVPATDNTLATAHEMWEAIERLQQGESLNIQDVKTNLFREFGKFTSQDRESMESYYSRFYKMTSEMIRNNLTVATMQVNVQFPSTTFNQNCDQPYHIIMRKGCFEFRPLAVRPCKTKFVAIVKQQHDLIQSHITSIDVLKQYQKEANEIRAERIAKNANPLALIAKPITPPSESASKEDSDQEQAQRDKDMQKNLALIAKYFKKIYKPTNNNLRISSNSRNKNVDTSPRYKNDNQTGQFGNQRTVTVAAARETVGSQETKKADTDEDIDEQELEAHYSYMAKIQEVPTTDSGTNTELLEQVQYDAEYNVFANERQHSEQSESICNICVVENADINVIPDSPDMCDDDIQNDQNAEDEHLALANLIANLTLDTEENKKILK
ncbi:hypothetical protein Tco_0983067 [Tanacetum coccineum]